jgi:ribulose-phosphate 3-epimerase
VWTWCDFQFACSIIVLSVQVDGGINARTAPLAAAAGANVLVAGSAVYGASQADGGVAGAIGMLKAALKKGLEQHHHAGLR